MEKNTEIIEWPLTAKVLLVRGKYYHEALADKIFQAVRFLDRSSGRYFYDLYYNDELFLTRVNPLFLDFIDHAL